VELSVSWESETFARPIFRYRALKFGNPKALQERLSSVTNLVGKLDTPMRRLFLIEKSGKDGGMRARARVCVSTHEGTRVSGRGGKNWIGHGHVV